MKAEHEETVIARSDQMAAKELDEKVSSSEGAKSRRTVALSNGWWSRQGRYCGRASKGRRWGTAWNCTFERVELIFSPYFLQLFLLILESRWGKKATFTLHLSLPLHDYVIFRWSIAVQSSNSLSGIDCIGLGFCNHPRWEVPRIWVELREWMRVNGWKFRIERGENILFYKKNRHSQSYNIGMRMKWRHWWGLALESLGSSRLSCEHSRTHSHTRPHTFTEPKSENFSLFSSIHSSYHSFS